MPPLDPRFENLLVTLSDVAAEYLEKHFPYTFPPVSISGIEVTQAIQYYRSAEHLTDPNDRKANNKVTLIANKPAWVRVYLHSTFADQTVGVTGRLTVTRTGGLSGGAAATFTLSPTGAGSATAENDPSYAAQRSTIGATLNFLIPADEMIGILTLEAEVWAPGKQATRTAKRKVHVQATLVQTLRLRCIPIHYTGPAYPATGTDLDLAAPTVTDLATTAGHMLTVAPVEADGDFSSTSTVEWKTPLTDLATEDGGCSQEWLDLNVEIAKVKAEDGNRTDVIYYGLLPVGMPMDHVIGCATSGVTSGSNGDGVTLAHEVGHAAGLAHAPCGTTSGDTAFPAYEPYDTGAANGRLGEYALDINTGAIHQPNEHDLMSYCGGDRFSLYYYAKLTDNDVFSPRSTFWLPHIEIPRLVDPYLWPWEYIPDPGPDDVPRPNWQTKPIDMVSIIGIVDVRGQVEVRSVSTLRGLPAIGAARTGLTAQLHGARGEILSQAPLMRLAGQGGCGCGCGGGKHDDDAAGPYVFHATVPVRKGATEVRITAPRAPDAKPSKGKTGDEVLWSRRAAKKPPRIFDFSVGIRGDEGSAAWKVEAQGDDVSVSMRFSKDEGRSWNSVLSGVRGSKARFNTLHLPPGKLLFQLLLNDGFTTVTAVSKPVEMAERPTPVAVLQPRRGERIEAGGMMRLSAAIITRDGTRRRPEEGYWTLDGRQVGRGRHLWIEAPPAGSHQCEFVLDERSGTSRASTKFTTVAAFSR